MLSLRALGRGIRLIVALVCAAAGLAAPARVFAEVPGLGGGAATWPQSAFEYTDNSCGSVTTTYVTDYARRIVHASSDGATEDFSWSYTYAPTGDRLAKTNDDDAAENEWYLPSGGDTLCDYRLPASGPEEHTGTYLSPGIDGRLVRVDGEGDATYTFSCALGTPHQVTDDTGAVVRRTLNDAWGNDIQLGPTPPPATGPGDRYGFTGRENDAESGLMHYRARSYDPVVGRFTSRDPVWHSNLYFYVGNNPTNQTDPSGMVPSREVVEAQNSRYLADWYHQSLEAAERYRKRGRTDTVYDAEATASLIREVLLSRNGGEESSFNAGASEFSSTLFSAKSGWHVAFAAQGFCRQAGDTLAAVAEGATKLPDSFEGITDTSMADVAETVLPGLEARADGLSSYEGDVVADSVGRTTFDAEFAATMTFAPEAIGANSILVLKNPFSQSKFQAVNVGGPLDGNVVARGLRSDFKHVALEPGRNTLVADINRVNLADVLGRNIPFLRASNVSFIEVPSGASASPGAFVRQALGIGARHVAVTTGTASESAISTALAKSGFAVRTRVLFGRTIITGKR